MKRLFVILFLLMAAVLPMSVQAAEEEVNLTYGKPFTVSKEAFLPGTQTNLMSDGDFFNSYYFLADANRDGDKTAWMTFDQVYDVTKIMAKGNRGNTLRFDFYNEDKVLIRSIVPNDGVENAVYVQGVKTVAVTNLYKGLPNAVREITVWGTPEQPDLTPPGEVSGIVSSEATTNTIKLQWTEPNDEDFSGTILFRDGSEIARLQKGTRTYTDTGLQPDTQYVYKFVTTDYKGNESPGVIHQARTAEIDKTAPGEITNVSTIVYNDRITVRWTNPPDLDFLEVRIFKEGTLVAVAVTPATQFTDYDLEEHTTYTYLFRTVDNSGNVSPGVSVTEKTKGKPPKVTGLVAVPGYKQAEIHFDKSTDPDVTSYNIYQGSVKVKTVNGPFGPFVVIDGLTNGTTYRYQVTAVSQWGESELSEVVEVTPVDQPPGRIENLRVIEKKTDRLTFAWDDEPTAEKYMIDITITHNQTASLGWAAGDPPTTKKTLESTTNQVTVTDLKPGERVEVAVSLVNEMYGIHGTSTLVETVPLFDIPDFVPVKLFTPKDVFDSSVSLASNFWPFLLLGLAFIVAPWLFYLLIRAVKRPQPDADQSSARIGREQQRAIRLSLRGDKRG